MHSFITTRSHCVLQATSVFERVHGDSISQHVADGLPGATPHEDDGGNENEDDKRAGDPTDDRVRLVRLRSR